jgi:hypothetical protein
MLDTDFFTRHPLKRIVDFYIEEERTHLEESLDVEDMIEWTDDELFHYCEQHDFDHIWIDLYIVSQLIAEDEDEI